MGCNKEEGRPKESEADAHSSFSLNLRYNSGCDCSMFHLCSGKKDSYLLYYTKLFVLLFNKVTLNKWKKYQKWL